MEVISCRGLVKSYGRRVAVRGLDLEVASGVVFGFLGPNGAGKTTTIRCLLGLSRPDRGMLRVLGERAGSGRLAGRVGALVEEPALYPWLTGRRNLQVLAGAGPPVPAGAVDRVLERVRLTGAAGQRVSTYSQGMRQRLGLAGALLRDPPLLILDEPTNGLDPVGIREFRGILRDVAAGGSTVLFSSHLLAEAQQVCDEVCILADGRVVTAGRVPELLAGRAAVRVRVAPADELAATQALAGLAYGREAPGVLRVERAPAREVSGRLLRAGLVLEELTPVSAGLEELFLALTGGSSSDAVPGR